MGNRPPNLLFIGSIFLFLAGLLLSGAISDLVAEVPTQKIQGLVTGPLVLVFGITMVVQHFRLQRLTAAQQSAFDRLFHDPPPEVGERAQRIAQQDPPDIG